MEAVNNVTTEGWMMNSGECFLEPETRVDVQFRSGEEKHNYRSDYWAWDYSFLEDYSNDIVAWRLSEERTSISPKEVVESLTDKPLQFVDNVNNPSHYTSHPSGIECIDVTRHMSFNLGNATKYIWRCDLKKEAIEDLRKAIFYLNDEIELRLKLKGNK